MINKRNLIIAAAVVAAVLVAGLLFWALRQQSQLNEMVEQLEFEKEALQDEYEDLAIQFDGFQQMDIRNDSLQDLLSREQQRVQDLLEELRITKVTNARRIAELKKELATVRTIMKGYVAQIDSLNRTNKQLTEENIRVKDQYHTVSRQAEQLKQEKTQLTEVVNRASMLEIRDFEFLPLNKRDHKTRYIGQTVKFQFNYTIAKNITCPPGIKILYLRVINPQGELMQKDTTMRFPFESGLIGYSSAREFEYSGEEQTGTMYFPLTAEPDKGIYNAEFFADGNLIGTFPFRIGK